MTSSALAIAVILALAGCVEDVPVLLRGGTAGQTATLDVPDDRISDELTVFRWELVEAPAGSETGGPRGAAPSSSFIPDRRGSYLVDRWLVEDVSERLTYHIIVSVAGAPPEANIRGEYSVEHGASVTLDGTSSRSTESRALSYHWRLAARAPNSQAVLTSREGEQTSMVADVAGEFVIELAVFDGELWSPEPARFTLTAR